MSGGCRSCGAPLSRWSPLCSWCRAPNDQAGPPAHQVERIETTTLASPVRTFLEIVAGDGVFTVGEVREQHGLPPEVES